MALRAPCVVMEYPVTLEGQMRTFVARMPVEALVDLSDGSDISVFLYCWANPERGQGAHAHYKPCDIASSPGSPVVPFHNGEFKLTLNLRDQDPDLLKLTACMRMKDPQTNNTRNAVLATSAVQLDRLLMGEEQSLVMYDQFTPGNYTEVIIRASNAADYGNCVSALTSRPSVRGALDVGPFIRLSRSNLWDMDVFEKEVMGVSNRIGESLQKHGVQYTPGGAQFNTGLTRCDRVLLFISLFLGTPAYPIIPSLQLGVRRCHVPAAERKR